jgi:hypothetical protein
MAPLIPEIPLIPLIPSNHALLIIRFFWALAPRNFRRAGPSKHHERRKIPQAGKRGSRTGGEGEAAMALTTGAWRVMAERCEESKGAGWRSPKVLDVDERRLQVLANDRKIRSIVFELTHRPALVKAGGR